MDSYVDALMEARKEAMGNLRIALNAVNNISELINSLNQQIMAERTKLSQRFPVNNFQPSSSLPATSSMNPVTTTTVSPVSVVIDDTTDDNNTIGAPLSEAAPANSMDFMESQQHPSGHHPEEASRARPEVGPTALSTMTTLHCIKQELIDFDDPTFVNDNPSATNTTANDNESTPSIAEMLQTIAPSLSHLINASTTSQMPSQYPVLPSSQAKRSRCSLDSTSRTRVVEENTPPSERKRRSSSRLQPTVRLEILENQRPSKNETRRKRRGMVRKNYAEFPSDSEYELDVNYKRHNKQRSRKRTDLRSLAKDFSKNPLMEKVNVINGNCFKQRRIDTVDLWKTDDEFFKEEQKLK